MIINDSGSTKCYENAQLYILGCQDLQVETAIYFTDKEKASYTY